MGRKERVKFAPRGSIFRVANPIVERDSANMISPRSYVLAGNSTFTLQNTKTGGRYTFKVVQPEESTPHFVKVMTGSDNESDYSVLGTIFRNTDYRHNLKKSRIAPEDPRARGFDWLFRHLDDLDQFPHVQFIPSGKCCRCGRTLTTPDSVTLGIGPECIKHGGAR